MQIIYKLCSLVIAWRVDHGTKKEGEEKSCKENNKEEGKKI